MHRTAEQTRDILPGSQRWDAGLQWYDFLLAIEFHHDGNGKMMYGEGQALGSNINFRHELSADLTISPQPQYLPGYDLRML
ncbi:hypothetical protein EPA93_47745 [Ktedonosporobacter rubrisoli]|uniref:Uncharacterized protein n=1 Tax=Ktedonosporobacter rubrisoli TaxID=2509675 RepID=A0A4P6K4W0_KTERU|nr:hypothetical protein [Ktedonosporobacter rubrisoli]QBD83254.1 hypothetical protein EPA93_47745 [Ktedonosporobacter rubrisoli]